MAETIFYKVILPKKFVPVDTSVKRLEDRPQSPDDYPLILKII